MTGVGVEDHASHDRQGGDATYVETCWRCAQDWWSYVKDHKEEWPAHHGRALPVVMALEPPGGQS
jgi:hypothetical protein